MIYYRTDARNDVTHKLHHVAARFLLYKTNRFHFAVVCSVIDTRYDVKRGKNIRTRNIRTRLGARGPLFCSYHV